MVTEKRIDEVISEVREAVNDSLYKLNISYEIPDKIIRVLKEVIFLKEQETKISLNIYIQLCVKLLFIEFHSSGIATQCLNVADVDKLAIELQKHKKPFEELCVNILEENLGLVNYDLQETLNLVYKLNQDIAYLGYRISILDITNTGEIQYETQVDFFKEVLNNYLNEIDTNYAEYIDEPMFKPEIKKVRLYLDSHMNYFTEKSLVLNLWFSNKEFRHYLENKNKLSSETIDLFEHLLPKWLDKLSI